MFERALIVLAVVAAVAAAAVLVRFVATRSAAAATGKPVPTALRARLPALGPTVVYLYGPSCAPCVDQRRVLDQLASEGVASVLPVDATKEREISDSLGISTVPSTVLVDREGRVQHVNLGYRSREKLEAQLAGVSGG